jgi:hypothetical protein
MALVPEHSCSHCLGSSCVLPHQQPGSQWKRLFDKQQRPALYVSLVLTLASAAIQPTGMGYSVEVIVKHTSNLHNVHPHTELVLCAALFTGEAKHQRVHPTPTRLMQVPRCMPANLCKHGCHNIGISAIAAA